MKLKPLVGSLLMLGALSGCDLDNNNDMEPSRYQLMLEITPQSAGNVVITPAKDDYEQDSIVILTAQAAEGYEFISWSGDIGSAEYDAQSLTLTMDNHKDITATFSAVVVPAKGDIVINEVRSTDGGYDFIELYNNSAQSFTFGANWAVNDLKGFEQDLEPGIAIPEGTTLLGGEFLVIATDQTSIPFGAPTGTIVAGEGDTDFGLGKGDTALLVHNNLVVQSAHWNDGNHVSSWGRLPDGGDWHTQDEALAPTPGAANKLPAPVDGATAANIVINEVVSKGRADADFVELYNTSSEPFVFAANEWELVDLDREANNQAGLTIPAGTEIPGHGFIVLLPNLVTGTQLPNGAPATAILNNNEDFGLGKGETIKLKYQGQVHQQVSYGDFHVNSYGRFPDGMEFIELADENAPQLYASPGRKNFKTPMHVIAATTLNFTAFNDQEAALESKGFRVFGKGADLAADVEPEYVAVSADSSTAWVSLQENNGLAKIDLTTKTITDIFPLGFKDYGMAGNEIDASDKDNMIKLQTRANVMGMYQPDGIATFSQDGIHYVLTANEGDVRDWFTNFAEGEKVADIVLDESVFTDVSTLQNNLELGRLLVSQYVDSDTAASSHNTLYSFGARSFSIFNGDTGEQVFDSGSSLAVEANKAGVYPDGRSDAKGTEPESVTTGMVANKRYAFIALERADAVAVYDISDVNAVSFVQMLVTQGDDAPEGVLFIPAEQSPTLQAQLVVANEDSGNITVYSENSEGKFDFTSRLLLEGGEGAAEITAYDAQTKRLFVVNNGSLLNAPRIEVVDFANPSNIATLAAIDISYYGAGVNSVAVSNGKLAAAIESGVKTDTGVVAMFNTSSYELEMIAAVGALPDMVTFSPDGKLIITADEGEPSEDYMIDPLGSVSIIELKPVN
ncbi:MAG TPA: lamin tail domain-containing protein [Pseudoalteromonas prydzensis]|uniref:Lamin tail domain-containing protein n=1 Tax=Pseudoalteromonas prydzensis TaxID=182141 RepID=A0A7V1GCU6_9GAMM|nr:choice-of-anchor I family protein [Pseudoalteromonas prydzensis]HEA15185.1 lamin tail domain-containing protein [Pseudoalteromonas prydzensis]